MPLHKLTKSTSVEQTDAPSKPPLAVTSSQPTTKQPTAGQRHLTTSSQRHLAPSSADSSDDVRTPGCDIHSSIKEVTSAIVHYCTERRVPSPRLATSRHSSSSDIGRSPRTSSSDVRRTVSPRPVWVESSFVGSRPIDASPEATELPALPSLVPLAAPKEGGELGVY